MIYQLKEKWAIEPIADMVAERKELFKISRNKLVEYLIRGTKNETSIIFIDEKDKKLNGFFFASIEEIDGDDVCFIHACIVDPEKKHTCPEFLTRLRKWCVKSNIKKIFMLSNEHIKGVTKKYGFQHYANMMSLDVGNDK